MNKQNQQFPSYSLVHTIIVLKPDTYREKELAQVVATS